MSHPLEHATRSPNGGRWLAHEAIARLALGLFSVLLGGYFVASYLATRPPPQPRELLLTPHDHLLGVGGPPSGSALLAVGAHGLVLRSTDAGKSWSRSASGISSALTAVSFADDQHGVAVGADGRILRTLDGGISWRERTSGSAHRLLAVQVLDQQSAFAVGAFGTFSTSTDGGDSWQTTKLSWEELIPEIIRESGYLEPNLNALYFSDPRHGWVAGEFGLLLRTSDGGRSWQAARYGAELPQLYALGFEDARAGWAFGQHGEVLRTSDGGATWEHAPAELSATLENDLFGAGFADGQAIVVGERVVLERTGGRFARRTLATPDDDAVLSDVAVRGDAAVAVGSRGALLRLASGAER